MVGDPKEVNHSVETLRVLAAFGVVLIHSFHAPSGVLWLDVVVVQASRFAVPFFFAAAGYFFARSLVAGRSRGRQYWRVTKTLLLLHVAWSVVYFVNPPLGRIAEVGIAPAYAERLTDLVARPWDFVLVGPGPHLWFLVALWLAITIVVLVHSGPRPTLLLPLAAALYIVGALGGSYADTVLGLHLPMVTRDGPFLSTLPVALGFRAGLSGTVPRLRDGVLMLALGLVGHFCELALLSHSQADGVVDVNYVFCTVLMGHGALLVGLARLPFLERSWLAGWGTATRGIYLSHFLITCRLPRFRSLVPNECVWMVVAPVVTFLLSLLLVRVLQTTRWSRWLV
jgi:surface polysaccharide O-acyltransferase-like enzyme